jgi:hemoglobin
MTLEGEERRRRLTEEIKERTGIDEPMIAALVKAFYAGVRQDPLLGPIFEERVEDWEQHLDKLCAFWSSVMLMTGRYHGRPMQAHLPLPVGNEHFERWLALFEATAKAVCPPQAAAHFIERAHRIADSLELGIATARGEIRTPRWEIRGGT